MDGPESEDFDRLQKHRKPVCRVRHQYRQIEVVCTAYEIQVNMKQKTLHFMLIMVAKTLSSCFS